MKPAYKGGPFSEDEKIFISDNCGYMDFAQIAEKLGRNPASVRKFIKNTLGKPVTSSIELNAEYSIKRSPIWKELKNQFTEDELKMFVYYWGRIVTQFQDDVLPTEEMQIVDYIRLEIMISRLLTRQHQNSLEIKEIETKLEQEREGANDPARLDMLSHQVAIRIAAQQAITKEHKELVQQKTSILDKMKGTREARIKLLESSRETFIGWIKQIITKQDLRQKLGTQMAKMRLAMKQEEEKLKQVHTYSDGLQDIPILLPEDINVQST